MSSVLSDGLFLLWFQVNYYLTAFYDSVLYLAGAYRSALDDGDDITDGKLVAQKLWNTSFQG